MGVQWTERLAVGYPAIDEQHQELFRRFNNLLEACRERRGKENIVGLLLFLDEYVASHFGAEERLMQAHGYPDAAAHREEHRHFIARLEALKESLQSRGASIDLVIETNQTLLDWVTSHIQNVDQRFGAFLRNCPA